MARECAAITCVALGTLVSTAAAQCPPQWLFSPEQGVPGTDGWVHTSTEWDPDGDGPRPSLLVVGGTFSTAGQAVANRIAAWDGTTWTRFSSAFSSGNQNGSSVRALAVYNGDLIAAGEFNLASLKSARNIARWNGFTWEPLGAGVNGAVSNLVVFNGELIAAGEFTTAGGVPAARLARWDGSTWRGFAEKFEGGVVYQGPWLASLSVFDNELIVGGNFATVGGMKVNSIARWSGGEWRSLGQGIGGSVNASVVHGHELYVAGQFSTAGGVAAGTLARWSGSAWAPVDPAIDPNFSFIRSLTVFNHELVAAGHLAFETSDSVSLARWDGASWHRFGEDATILASTLAVYDGRLVAGGSFTREGQNPLSNIATWTGARWERMGSGVAATWMTHAVRALTRFEGDLVFGGSFDFFGGSIAKNVVRWDGKDWLPMIGSGPSPDDVNCLQVFRGSLIAGADWGGSGHALSRWNGAQWEKIGEPNGSVLAMAVLGDELIVAGQFDFINSVACSGLARWDGLAWRPLGAGDLNGWVGTCAVYDGELVASGSFQTPEGLRQLAAWNGSQWRALGPANARARVLRVCNGELFAGGYCTTWDCETHNGVARWDGAQWVPLGAGMDNIIFAIGAYGDDLIAGGRFKQAGDRAAEAIARWDGTSWSPMGAGIYGEVLCLEAYGDELVVGGDFYRAHREPSTDWARWGPPLDIRIVSGPASSGACAGAPIAMTVIVEADSTVSCRWRKNGVPLSVTDPRVRAYTTHNGLASVLVIAEVSPDDAGTYECVVSNECMSVISSGAVLAVCFADANCDGFVNGLDFDAFISAFESGDPAGDIDRSGFVNGIDFDLFAEAFAAGC